MQLFDGTSKRAELVDEYSEKFLNPYAAADRGSLIADGGVELAVRDDPALAKGVNVWRGELVYEQVAEAVVSGIEGERAEIDVAPLSLRAGSLMASLAPVTVARLQRRLGSVGVADSIAKGQRPRG